MEHVYKSDKHQLRDFVMNIGDDDIMIPNILPRLLDLIYRYGEQPYMFQAILNPSPHRGNRNPIVLWNDEQREIERKAVTGQNLIIPSNPYYMGDMTDDFIFIKTTIENYDGLVKWIPLVVCECY